MCSHYWLISVCNVCSRGGDREAVIRGIDIDKNQIHVHYVGGSEDDDEWVPCEPQRVQLPPMPEKALSHLELFLSRVREQAAAEAAAKEEGHKRQKKKRGNAQASWSPGQPN